MKKIYATGIMSGTSLDGMDIAHCSFQHSGGEWEFEIIKATTLPYSDEWRGKLEKADELNGRKLSLLHNDYGRLIGKEAFTFLKKNNLKSDIVGSHGHTVFHQPENNLSLQIGSGAEIASQTGIPVAFDFRSGDIALGGQGAPLVPIGDKLLFKDFHYCLNLGGIANISYPDKGIMKAFDICPANMVLNYLSKKAGKPFDENGYLARSGKINDKLLEQLNSLSFYNAPPPKSLGKEWVYEKVIPLMKGDHTAPDLLRTFTEHIAIQTGEIAKKKESMLITGGGAFNLFLLERIKKHCENTAIKQASPLLIEYKEALIFAFLAVLRHRGEVNCLGSVTGAKKDSVTGSLIDL